MKKFLFPIFLLFVMTIPLAMTLINVFSGGMAFWFDPARDMLSAWNNLSKLTLIGSTSGIPGIFYGPYWIWWLSFAEIFSKDPRFVLFLTTALPYLIVFPLVLYKFSNILDKFSCFLLWILFFFAFQGYISALWNPNLAPLLFLCVIYLLVAGFEHKGKKKYFYLLFAGILSGIAFNIHISFSSGFLVGAVLFLIFNPTNFAVFKSVKETVKSLVIYILGFAIVFWPYLFFEMRHGFEQTKTLINAILKRGDVVGVHGLSKHDILLSFLAVFGKLFNIQTSFAIAVILFTTILILVLVLLKKITFSPSQKNLIFLLFSIIVSVMGIYLSAKNPIWGYHLIGMEIMFLLLTGLILTKLRVFRWIVFVWVVVLAYMQITSTVHNMKLNPLRIDTLNTKEYITRLIIMDSKNNNYSVFAYNGAIYNYDYSYLFRWLAKKDFSYDPGFVRREGTVYLILPVAKKAIIDDFIHYRTPDKFYKTTKTWTIPDGTVMLRRSPIQQV